jgi:hypothetical protein
MGHVYLLLPHAYVIRHLALVTYLLGEKLGLQILQRRDMHERVKVCSSVPHDHLAGSLSDMASIPIAQFYQKSFESHPYRTLAFTNGGLNALGDAVAQVSQRVVSFDLCFSIVC